MNKTIRVIELLNKIANGEEIPKKIKFDKTIWKYNIQKNDYIDTGLTRLYFFRQFIIFNRAWLNDKVEIIEEPNEIDIQGIEELLTIEDYEFDKTDGRLNRDKINELVRAVKQLDRNIKENNK